MNKKSAKMPTGTKKTTKTKKKTDKTTIKDDPTDNYLYEAVKSFSTEKKTNRVINLSDSGPVRLIKTSKGKGLLIHHACGDNTISLVSLTTGEGFTLSKDAARDLSSILSEWAGKETSSTISQWVTEGDSWTLAE